MRTSPKRDGQVWLLKQKRKQKKPEINIGNSGDERPIEPGNIKVNVKWVGCGRVNVLMAMANCDAFTLRFFALLSF